MKAPLDRFIDYLDKKLCKKMIGDNEFIRCGPRSFFYQDKTDTIFVKITDDTLIIVTDGENVIGSHEIHMLGNIIVLVDNNWDDETIFNHYLQKILVMF